MTANSSSSSGTTNIVAKSDDETEEILDRMLMRLALCDDSKLEGLVSKLLPSAISSLSSSSPSVRNKVVKILTHVNNTSSKWIHSMYLATITAFYAKELEVDLMEYKPDIIASVHHLIQHIPLLVLKWQGLQKKVIFVTVITDLNSCHPTWFHPSVNRCYSPSEEVAKRASLVGLEDSQKKETSGL